MRDLKNLLPWLVASVLSLVTTACNPFSIMDPVHPNDKPTAKGYVLNDATDGGIGGIRIRCLGIMGDRNAIEDETFSKTDAGTFDVWYDEEDPFESLLFEDVDGAKNHGVFADREVRFDIDGGIVVKLTPVYGQ
jgi:hypothetical protein